ncbi:uncharacterized protein METZ01_LOCUS143389 [marine metagenome]|uniref:Uncharacterized protein n=1 Tax=marine metagenome TaxID=408172 RepID=A0A381ZMQ7_9ZZZZ
MKKLIALLLLSPLTYSGEMNSWECSAFEDAKIIGDDGDYLGRLGPSYMSDSIYNSSSSFSSTYSSDSIFNSSSKYGNSYSSTSVFNDGASSPPIILSSDGISLGKLSVGPSYYADRYDPYDIKYTCDWD